MILSSFTSHLVFLTEDVMSEGSVLLRFCLLCHRLDATSLSSLFGGVAEEATAEFWMVGEIVDQVSGPFWMVGPLDFGSA
jgi:hypothetical protein